jgi:hypothetical protein
VRFDGDSNVTDDNSSQATKTYLHRVETEDGTVKEVRLEHLQKAAESILLIAAGNSNEIVVNSEQFSKHFSPMTRTLFGTVIERR